MLNIYETSYLVGISSQYMSTGLLMLCAVVAYTYGGNHCIVVADVAVGHM